MDKKIKSDYDTHWKKLITNSFEEFVAFFLPELSPLIDFNIKPEFLEQEFHDVITQKFKGKRIVDKLAKVRLKSGENKWILIHIEVQSSFETNFAERMFIYYYLIYDKYGKQDIEVLAIYTNKKTPKHYNQYYHAFGSTSLTFKFKAYRVNRQDEIALKASNNIFALAVLACLYLQKSGKDMSQRFAYKKELVRLAYSKYATIGIVDFRHKIMVLFQFIHYIVVLKSDFKLKFKKEIYSKYKENNMVKRGPYEYTLVNAIYESMMGESLEEFLDRTLMEMEQKTVKRVTEQVKEQITEEITEKVTEEITKQLNQELKLKAAKAAKEAEKARLEAAKEAEKARLEAAREAEKARLEAAKEAEKARLEAAEEIKKAKLEVLTQAAGVLLKSHTKEEVATFLNVPLEEIEAILKKS